MSPRLATRCLIYIVLLAVAATVVDRTAATALFAAPDRFIPGYESYYHPTASAKMQAAANRELDVDGLFIGNSLTMLDVDPRSFDGALAKMGITFHSYNFAIPSVGVGFWPRFFETAWEHPAPKTLLLGVQPRDLTQAGVSISRDLLNRFFGSEGWRNRDANAFERVAEGALGRNLWLWGRRGYVVPALSSVVRARARLDTDEMRIVGDQGFAEALPATIRPPERLRAEGARIAHRAGEFAMAPEARTALRELAAWIRVRGGRLVLFTMPVYADPVIGASADAGVAFVRDLEELARVTPGIAFVDSGTRERDRYGISDYVDVNHLTPPAARRFSARLASELAAQLNSTRSDTRRHRGD